MNDRTVNAACSLFLLLFLAGVYYFFTPFEQGFWCSDNSIRYKPEDLVIRLRYLLLLTVVIPGITLGLLANSIYLHKFYFGFIVNLFCTILTKFLTGRLRPHFIEVCRPNVDCTNAEFANAYITNYTCQNENYWAVKQSRQSFFSGHASIATYTVTYLVLFIHQRFHKSSNLLKPTIEVLLLMLGLIPGITQVWNHWHHWNDVAFGYLAGVCVALYTYKHVSIINS